jgi:hypothetical protein
MIPMLLQKTVEIQLDFLYKEKEYRIRGISKNKNNKLILQFGNYGDDFPCIINEYDIKKREYKVSKLRAKAFGGWNEDDRVICLKPSLPEKGALDILVMVSLALANYIDKGCTVKINDDAKIDNDYPLSWKKFFTKRETTYSKYGFILRDPNDTIESFDDELDLTQEFLEENLIEYLSSTSIRKIKKEIDIVNKKLKEKKKPIINFNEHETFEKLLRDIFETRKYEKIIDILDEELEFDLRGIWYLSWEYYDVFIPDTQKVLSLKVSKTVE